MLMIYHIGAHLYCLIELKVLDCFYFAENKIEKNVLGYCWFCEISILNYLYTSVSIQFVLIIKNGNVRKISNYHRSRKKYFDVHNYEACITTYSSRETNLIEIKQRTHIFISFNGFYIMGTHARTLILGILHILKPIY